MISTIGLSLALTSISQTTVAIDSYRRSLFMDFFSSTPFEDYSDFEVDMGKPYLSEDINRIPSEIPITVSNYIHLGERAADNLGFSNYLDHETWHFYIGALILDSPFNSSSLSTQFTLVDLMEDKTLRECEKFLISGQLPLEEDEVVFLAEQTYLNDRDFRVGDVITLSSYNITSNNRTVKIAGIMEYPLINQNDTLPQEGSKQLSHFYPTAVKCRQLFPFIFTELSVEKLLTKI